jgi:protein-disulfide isomerase
MRSRTPNGIGTLLAGVVVMVLLLAACDGSGGDEAASFDSDVEDCVADGSCSPGPEEGALAEETYQGLPVGFTEDGFPYIGDPEAAVSLIEFSDYLCPFCLRHATQTTPALLLEYGNSGQVNFVFRDFPLAGLHPTAPTGHNASVCVSQQGAAAFWEFHDLIFRNQSQWANLPDPDDYLAESAEGIGIDMDAYRECMASPDTAELVGQRVSDGQSAGFNGTPSFQFVSNDTGASYDLLGAQPLETFQSVLDALVAGEDPPTVTASGDLSSEETPVAAPTFTVDPDSQDTYDGLPVGVTTEGFPFIGDPEAAVSVLEYSDYLCPFCFRHTTETAPALLEQYAGSGDVNFVFRDFPLEGLHPTAPMGHAASVCVTEQGAAFFWAFHDSLFFNQQQWAGLPDPSDYLAQTAEGIGVDMDAYRDCLGSGRTATVVAERVAEGQAAGFNGTPSFQFLDNNSGDVYELVGAHPLETFQGYLDAMVAGEAPSDAAESDEQSAELPLWANEEGLVPDPDRPGYTLAGDAYKGDPDAPLVVVEYSDLQCPSCQRHALETQPVIDESFVDTGQVMWVFKHFPLSIHPQSPAAATAAECAGDQGRFFEMERLIFETQEEWSVDDPDPVLLRLADELGLNAGDFSSCLSSRAALQRVLTDLFDGSGLVASTPTFFVIQGGQGARFEGARDAEDFVAILEGQLESALAAESEATDG